MTTSRVPVRMAASALTVLGVLGGAAAVAGSGSETVQTVETDVKNVARELRILSFPVGQHMDERISDQVNVPPGVTSRRSNLPPRLDFNPLTTAVHGTPTTPGTWTVTATAYIAGVPVESARSQVTVTDSGGGGTSAPARQPAPTPMPSPAPGPIDLHTIDGFPVPEKVKDVLRDMATDVNGGLGNMWVYAPESSLSKSSSNGIAMCARRRRFTHHSMREAAFTR